MSAFIEIRTQANANANRSRFFWNNGLVGMIQHDDFWDLISKKVHVCRSDLSGTTSNYISLNDGREVSTDVLLCGTGWSASYPFFSSKLVFELGLPHNPCESSEEEGQSWNNLMHTADQQILKKYPILARPPPDYKPSGDASLTPARRYQGIASFNRCFDCFPRACSDVQ